MAPDAEAQSPYCLGGATSCNEHIARVEFVGIDKSSGCGNAMGYSNYSISVPPGTVAVGQSYGVTVTNGAAFAADSVYMWIDWDQDTTLGNTSSEVYRLSTADGGATFTTTFNPPSAIANGPRRVRFRLNNSGIRPYCFLPCGTISAPGEVEDYTVTVTGGRTIEVTGVQTRQCTGTTFPIDFSINGTYQSGNIFTAQVSSASGSFAAPVAIGSLIGTSGGTINAMLSGATVHGTGYRVRIVASNPPTVGVENDSDITVWNGFPYVLTWTGTADSVWTNPSNWDNPCAIPTPGDTVYIPAGTRQPDLVPAISLTKLRLDNAAGINLSGSMIITHALELADGCITLGSANLALTATAAITAAGSNAFVITNGAGELRQAGLGAGLRSGPVLFPVGTRAGSYTPAWIENHGSADEYRIRLSDSARTHGVAGFGVDSNAVNRTWHVTEAFAGGSDVTLRLQWNAQDELPGFHPHSCFVARFDGNGWVPLRAPTPATGTGPFEVSASGITAFSPFVVADSLSRVPVDLLVYTVEHVGGTVRMTWRTANERDNAGFFVERRSRDESRWTDIGFIAAGRAAGDTYTFTDDRAEPGAWEYRLVQIDYDGARTTYRPLSVLITAAPGALELAQNHPNPAATTTTFGFHLPAERQTRFLVTDLLGRIVGIVVDKTLAAGRHAVTFDVTQLPAGVYRCTLTTGDATVSRLMTVMRH